MKGHPSSPLTPLCLRSSAWMTSRGKSIPTQRVTITPFGTVNVHGKTNIQGHCMQVHVLCRASMGPKAACLHCASCHMWGVVPGILLSASLPKEYGCLPHCSPGQSHHQKSHSSQPGVGGNPPEGNLEKICHLPSERLDPE